MRRLLACPFCRELFSDDETSGSCPDCAVELVPLERLPPSADAAALDDPEETSPGVHPDDERLALWHWQDGRGALFALSLAGLAAFTWLPWLTMTAPDDWSPTGWELAQSRVPWLFGGAVGSFVLIGLLLSRRTRWQLRGVRVISTLFASLPMLEVATLMLMSPQRASYFPLEYHWEFGAWAGAAISLAATAVALRLGGPAPSPQPATKVQQPGPSQLH